MWIVRLALYRPYTFIVGALVLLLVSPLVLFRTPTDIFPNINIPVVSVIWLYQGMNAQELEHRIVGAHERALSATVNDIERIESQTLNGVGVIKIYFQPGASVDAAVSQVTAVSQTVLRQFPQGTTPPLIIRYNASSVPILQLSVSSPTVPEQQLYDLAQNQMRIGLATVRGAQVPFPYGGKTRQISVDLDLHALQSKGLSPLDVVNAVNAQNVILPGGSAKIGSTEYDVDLNGSPQSVEELNDLPIRTVNGATIYIRDVAHVRDGYLPQQNVVRQDGKRGVLLTILKSGTASTLDVVERVKQTLPRLIDQLPPEVEVQELADQSIFVRAAISAVVKEGVIAAALTALMILLFLGSWRSTLIIALSIPLSVLASLTVLSALGETINLMTLGGLALAVGILVDEATVTIENIERHLHNGMPLEEGIITGAGEIAMPAFVSMLCICIVFVPMFFLTGVAKYLFVPLAKAVVFAMIASYILSRTLVPTLVMYLFRKHHEARLAGVKETMPKGVIARFFSGIQHRFEAAFTRFRNGYARWLQACLEQRKSFALIFLIFCVGSWLLIPQLGQDFFPNVDTGQFRLHVRAKAGTRIEESARIADEVENVIRQAIPPEQLNGVLDNIGVPNSGISLSYSTSGLIGSGDMDILVSLNQDHSPTDDYVRKLRRQLPETFPGLMFYFLPADIVSQTLNFGLPAPFNIQIAGRNLEGNQQVAYRLAQRIREVSGAVDVRVQQPFDQPKLHLEVDRTKAAALGLTEREVANSVLVSLSGSGVAVPGYWLNPKNGISYVISASAPQYTIKSLTDINTIPVATDAKSGDQIVANLATMHRGSGTPVVSHLNVQPVIDIYGGVSGRDLGGVLRDIEPLIKQAEKELPKGSWMLLRGQAETMHTSFLGLSWGLLGALALIYLLLVVNFQSWTDPFIIVTALPGALAGVTWALFLTNTTLNVPAMMGAIMSLGVSTANAVLVVSFARDNLRHGKSPLQAALEAGVGRMRPVLMTALAMIIGMIPMSLGLGEGGEQNAPLGRAVIGGLVIATLATLFFVPTVFCLLRRRHAHEVNSTPLAEAMTHGPNPNTI